MSSRTSLQHSSPEFNDKKVSKSIINDKSFYNVQLKAQSDNEKNDVRNEKRESLSTSSYKFLSWREKDRRRRFRDEWKHMWLVIPHGNFEVMCLICHKVMTQRKLDTIKRHTVRRHTEVLDMDQVERTLLFERLFIEHNSAKFSTSNSSHNTIAASTNNSNNAITTINNSSNNNNDNNNKNAKNSSINETRSENEKLANLETEVGDLEKLLSGDCISATSSSSLSPLELQQNNANSKYFPKRLKYNRKNIKINFKTNQKNDSAKCLSTIKSLMDDKTMTTTTTTTMMNKTVLKSKLKVPIICDTNKSFKTWPNSSHLSHRSLAAVHKSFSDSLYSLNGSSCQSMPTISKCPLCLEDCSQNGVDSHNTFNRLLNHMQQKHSDKLHNSNSSFDLTNSKGSSSNDLLHSLLMPPSANNINYMSPSNGLSNAHMISFLYYQDLMRQAISTNRSSHSQCGPISSEPGFLQSPSALATSSIYPLLSPQSPQYSVRPLSSTISAFNVNSINENMNPTSMSSEDTGHIFSKISPLKKTKFSAESFISESCSQSAFYSPKSCKIECKDQDQLKTVKTNLTNQIIENIKFHNQELDSHNKEIKLENILSSHPDHKVSKTILTASPNIDDCIAPKSSAQGSLTCHALRFGAGQDLKVGLLEYVKKKKISAAFIMTCCGSLNQARLRMANSGISNTPLEIIKFTKHFEIVSLVGSIFDHDCHLHISLSDSSGNVIGGHVIGDLIIHTTAEVMLGQICGVQMRREPDKNTGYSELAFSTTDII